MFFLIGLVVGVLITLNKDKLLAKAKDIFQKTKNGEPSQHYRFNKEKGQFEYWCSLTKKWIKDVIIR